MKTVLKTKSRDEIINFIVNILNSEYTKYLSLFECKNNEMNDFIKYSIEEVLCDIHCHLGHGFVKNIGNILIEDYNFYFNLKTGTYIIELNSSNDDMIPIDNNIVNWELWDDYEVCLKEAVNKFSKNPNKVYYYKLVQWPESQFLMEHPRFHECLFVDNIEGHDDIGSSAYMCPIDLYEELFITINNY